MDVRTLPWDVVKAQPTKLQCDKCCMSITGCSGLATMAWSSIVGDNVPSCIPIENRHINQIVVFDHYGFCYCININPIMGMFLHVWSALHEHECKDGHDCPDMSYTVGPNGSL